jgi:tetratricopeptide (TPR) repeat protein
MAMKNSKKLSRKKSSKSRTPSVTNSKESGHDKFKIHSFSFLIGHDDELLSIRQEYKMKSRSDRRAAADWNYSSEIAEEIFDNALMDSGRDKFGSSNWPPGVMALTIDPLFAPALLTVGTVEYQNDRIEDGMKLFIELTKLPEKEKDLSVIIDKAGDFLIDNEDYENALSLYSVAEKTFPTNALYFIGSGYCLGKLRRHKTAVEKHRRAVKLEPNNYKHLNDLGFSLLEAGDFVEGEETLKNSISLAPEEYEIPRNNLKELKKMKKAAKSKNMSSSEMRL